MSTSIGHPPRLRNKVKHILSSTMLCCGRKKEARELEAHAMCEDPVPGRRPLLGGGPGPHPHPGMAGRPSVLRGGAGRLMPEMVVQSDFRKVSGISTEIFRQIEAVEKDFDPRAAEAVEKRGEMIIRLLDPASLGRVGAEACRRYLRLADAGHVVQFVEIVKRPGQTLGLYIREGDLVTQSDGVFISRIALESAVYSSGLLKVEDEILAVNLVDVRHVSLDDVVIIMSIPRRLVLTIRSRISGRMTAAMAARPVLEDVHRPPVVVVKKEFVEDPGDVEYPPPPGGPNGWMRGGPRTQVMLEPQRQPSAGAPYYYNVAPGKPPPEEGRMMWGGEHPPQGVLTRQPKPQLSFPTTLQALAEQVHTFHAEPTDPRRLFFPPHPQQVHPRSERSLPDRYRLLEEANLRSRSTRLLRTESEQRISTLGSDAYDRYYSLGRPLRRSGSGLSVTMQRRGRPRRPADELTQPLQPQQVATLSGRRRTPHLDGSASDTEATDGPSAKGTLVGRGGAPRPAFPPPPPRGYPGGPRSNSLPRVRMSEMDFRRFQQLSQQQPAVRLLPYDSQSDSDGALSAPELPATRAGRRDRARRMTSPIFTSAEYSQWLTRAPSTSALYDRTRRLPGVGRPQLPRSAHSAESLLDRLKQEEQRTLGLPSSVSTLYARRPMLRSATDLASELGRHTLPHPSHQPSPSLLTHPYIVEYLRQIPNPTPVKPSEERLQLLTLNPREFLKYRPEKDSETVLGGDGGFSGLLWVHLLAGRGLRPTGGGADHFRDLYCVIECDRVHKARTVVRTGEHSFDWDEVFELELVDNTEVAFLLYSWDPQLRHKLCYKGSVHLLTILRESPAHSLALKMEPRGTLYLKLRYRDPRQTFQRLPAPIPGSALFGVDLETVVLRENSGISVPLLVRRCAEEVERRGLDIVGIYRLCGSAVRKKTLRDSFERNAHAVDLSVDHVPDINVITSVLKDYLRELPEPLFTRGLFDMLVDGFSVCLPDDPEGNAKLMFSILDCLPKVNRCTVLYLMDHLKRVTGHSDRNKMSSQSLAICFGPVVMCHTETGAPVAELRKPIEVFKYLLDIWPAKRVIPPCSGGSSNSSGSNGVPDERPPPGGSGGGRGAPPKKPMTWVGQRPLPESSC